MPLIREEPISQQSVASTDGSKLFTFERPKRIGLKSILVDKIALSMNQEQHFALFRAYFQTPDAIQIKIGDKRTIGSSLLAAIILNPPIPWDRNDSLKAFIMINSGSATVCDMRIYWSYDI